MEVKGKKCSEDGVCVGVQRNCYKGTRKIREVTFGLSRWQSLVTLTEVVPRGLKPRRMRKLRS